MCYSPISTSRVSSSIAATWSVAVGISFLTLAALAGNVHGAAFVVDTAGWTADVAPGNGVCADGSSNCTLRAAIEEAEALAGADVINVSTGSNSVLTVSPTATVSISEQTTIDGTGQCPADVCVELDCTGVGGGNDCFEFAAGSDNSIVKGVAFKSAPDDGVAVNADNCELIKCNSGVDATGSCAGNGDSGIEVNNDGFECTECVSGCNLDDGILINNADNGILTDSSFGTDLGCSTNLANIDNGAYFAPGTGWTSTNTCFSQNNGSGCYVSFGSTNDFTGCSFNSNAAYGYNEYCNDNEFTNCDASDNFGHGYNINSGSDCSATGGDASDNGMNGFNINDGVDRFKISQVEQTGNTNLGIDLVLSGDAVGTVTADDVNDTDVNEGNDGQNKGTPTLAETPASTRVVGTLNSLASTTFTIEVFSNTACDASGFGEGETYLGSDMITTDGNGDVAYDVTVAGTANVGDFVTTTITDPNGNTSEFSQCVAVTAFVPTFSEWTVIALALAMVLYVFWRMN